MVVSAADLASSAIHTAYYLFDLSYRFDPVLALHHTMAIAALQLGLAPLQSKSHGAQTGGELLLPFWIPGLVLGDLSIDLSYLLHHGVLKLPKQQSFQKINAVFGLLARGLQWIMIFHVLRTNILHPEMFWEHKLVATATLPMFAYCEFTDVRTGLAKAFRPVAKSKDI